MTIASITLRVAILVNHPPNTLFWPEIKQAFVDAFDIIAPHAVLDFFDPIEAREYPDPSHYELIILSGGHGDSSASDPWILQMLEFIRTTVRETPNTKLLGICWGHQAIARAFGGTITAVPAGPIVSSRSTIFHSHGLLTSDTGWSCSCELDRGWKSLFPIRC